MVRTVGSDAKNAVADGTSTTVVQNEEVYDNNYANGSLNEGNWVARYPGVLGNSIKVGLITADVANFATIEYLSGFKYSDIFDAAPATSEYGEGLGLNSLKDEMHIVVLDEDGGISGTPGTVLEQYSFVSQASDPPVFENLTSSRVISFDKIKGVINVESGVLISDILKIICKDGWFFPVTPGSKYVSIGGIIANNVHGKNTKNNQISYYVKEIKLLEAASSRYIEETC